MNQLGLSQQALSDVLGVPRNTVARWERGDLRVERPEWLTLALNTFEARSHTQTRADASDHAPLADQPIHLPAELSSFVGRDDEVAGCSAPLTQERLVTFTGAGGIGKSRLAAKVAREAAKVCKRRGRGRAWLVGAPGKRSARRGHGSLPRGAVRRLGDRRADRNATATNHFAG